MIAMNPITASGLIAASIALFLRQAPEASRKQTILGLALAAGVMAMGGCFLLLSYHESVAARWLTLPPLSDGSLVEANGARISASFVLVGASLLALNYKTVGGFRPGELACALTAIIAILSVVAHAHHLTGFYVSATYTPASFLTSVCFFLLAPGILLARADRGTLAIIVSETAAGMLARRLIPLAILLPIQLAPFARVWRKPGCMIRPLAQLILPRLSWSCFSRRSGGQRECSFTSTTIALSRNRNDRSRNDRFTSSTLKKWQPKKRTKPKTNFSPSSVTSYERR